MSKIIFYNIPASGHINPMQAVIAELIKNGHQVIYYNGEDTRAQITQTGAEFRAYPTQAAETLRRLMDQTNSGGIADNALQFVRIAEMLLPSVFETLRAEKPDLVIHDSLAGWGKQAAEVLKIPAAAVLSTFALNMRSMPSMPPLAMLSMMRDLAVRMPAYLQSAGRMKKAFGVRNYGLTGALMSTNALNIVFTSREFQPAGETFDASYKFVGPSITERPDTTNFPFDQLTKKPVVYISLGTINNQNLDFYKACFTAFSNHPGQFVLSAGKQTDLKALEPIPANFIVRNFVPQLEVLQHADLFITHGGMNSVHEGLWYGVPLVVVPQHVEQAAVALQVARHGAGVMAAQPGETLTVDMLRSSVELVLSSRQTYQEAAKRLGASFRAAGGYAQAAQELANFV
jgi:MGT family glycosyltransferase